MLNKIKDFIQANNLLSKSKKYLVGFSGGADSLSLVIILQELGYYIEAVHCNFNLRGEESVRDENFCKEICSKLNIKMHLIHFNTKEYSALHKVSIEMAARELRYSYFERLRKSIDADGICIAHHKEDSVETILMNIIRGTGVKGLIGIHPINNYIIRPILNCTRSEIEEFLRTRGYSYITDSSNLKDDVMRNKLRLNIIPLLEAINPAFNDAVVNMSHYISEAKKIINLVLDNEIRAIVTVDENETIPLGAFGDEQIKPKLPNIKINIQKLKLFVSPSYLLFYLLNPYGFTSSQIEQLSNIDSLFTGKVWKSSNYDLLVDRNYLIVKRHINFENKFMKIPLIGTYICFNQFRLLLEEQTFTSFKDIPKDAYFVAIDMEQIKFPLILRTYSNGDRFVPFGMSGSKLVSDFLTDIKTDKLTKKNQLVLEDSTGLILWVVGYRISNLVRISKQTKSVLLLKVIKLV